MHPSNKCTGHISKERENIYKENHEKDVLYTCETAALYIDNHQLNWKKKTITDKNNLQELYNDKHQRDWKKAIADKNNLQELLRETQEEVKVKEEQLQVWMGITFIITSKSESERESKRETTAGLDGDHNYHHKG